MKVISRMTKPTYISRYLVSLSAVALLLGCSSNSPTSEPTSGAAEVTSAPHSVHVAFAGGGWRAHTGHSGWIMSLLDNGNKTLDQVFTHVETVSSNSGGSWFNTMLSYSTDFTTAIQASNAIETWATPGPKATGWLGQQQYLFDQAPCHAVSGEEFLGCVFWHYTGGVKEATNWHQVIEKIVFGNNAITENLNGTRQSWATDKSLLLAATLLTREVVIGQRGLTADKQYYQACFPPSTPDLRGDDGASCTDATGKPADVTPVTFSSLAKDSKLTQPAFLPSVKFATSGQKLNMGYSENALWSPAKANAMIANPIQSHGVPVITAAAASSAAAGFVASHEVSNNWELSYLGMAEPVSFQLAGGLKKINPNGMAVQSLADAKVVQIADGGPVDNSGVAQIVRFLQLNNQASGFNIVAFDNVQQVYTPTSGNGAKVGIDLANLFGQGLSNGDQICSGLHGTGYCVSVPDLKVFEQKARA